MLDLSSLRRRSPLGTLAVTPPMTAPMTTPMTTPMMMARIMAIIMAVILAATVATIAGSASGTVHAEAAALTPVLPARLLNTRAADTIDGKDAKTGALGAGAVYALVVTNRGAVPADASAVMLNVTTVGATAPGFLTVYPCGATRPNTSSVNYSGAAPTPNAVLSQVGADGKVCIFSTQQTNVIADVNAYVPSSGSPIAITPTRLADTRPDHATVDNQFAGSGTVAAATNVRIQVTGRGGVPVGASAAMLNVTAVGARGPGYLTVYPCTAKAPQASNVNYAGAAPTPNAVLAQLNSAGEVCVYTSEASDVAVDVSGYVPRGVEPTPIAPARLADTRAGSPTVDGRNAGDGRVAGESDYVVDVLSRAGVPANTTAVMLNVTAVRPAANGYLAVYPCGAERPDTSSVNYTAGAVVPNAVLAKVGEEGRVCVYTTQPTDIAVDISAYSTARVTLTSTSCTQPSASECQALIDLFNSTDGTLWFDARGWGSSTDACTWITVTCSGGHVTELDLTHDNLVGPLPASFGNLTHLTLLSLAENSVTGTLPDSMRKLTKLNFLDLSGNALTGSIPAWIGDLTELTSLTVAGNAFTGGIPSEVTRLTKLTALDLDSNTLTGPIPADIGNLSELVALNLFSNKLSGTVPASIGNLPKLDRLDLGSNNLTGPLPDSLGNLTNLTHLGLSDNPINTTIPASLGKLKKLGDLQMANDQLSGTIPASFGGLSALEYLDLSHNKLSGNVAPALQPLMQLGRLTSVGLTGNGCLTSSVPSVSTWLSGLDPQWNVC